MPELPEVETARLCLERWARGRQVRRVVVGEPRVVARGGPPLGKLVGARFVRFDRRGKHLMIGLRAGGKNQGSSGAGGEPQGSSRAGRQPLGSVGKKQASLRAGRQPLGLWSHLGMTGKWLRRQTGEEPPRFSRVQIDLSGGVTLHYVDLRLFGRLRLVSGAAFEKLPAVAALGPDPLHEGVDPDHLAARLQRSSKAIKPLLLDQRLAAGVGNIQASESLFRAGIDPRRPGRSLRRPELAKLARGIRASIAYSLSDLRKQIGATAGRDVRYVEEPAGPNPFRVYDRAGEPCPRCRQGVITRLVQDARATFFCPRCQK